MRNVCIFVALSASLHAQTMRGLYTNLKVSESKSEDSRVVATLKANRYLNGVLVSASWQDLEPAREKYDFSTIDRAVAIAHQAGKQFKLKVTPGAHSPRWIYDDGARWLETPVANPHRSNYGEKVRVPVPWDPVYQKHFSRLIRKLGERYAADSRCVAVTLTCANFMSGEMHLPRGPEDLQHWKQLGLTGERLLGVYQKYMDEWAAAFPGRLVCLHMSQSAPLPDRSPAELAEQIVHYGLEKHPRQLALQNCQLQGRTGGGSSRAAKQKSPANSESERGWSSASMLLKYKDRLVNGYQSLASFRTPDRQGIIEVAVLKFVRVDAEYWELWTGDGFDIAMCAKISAALQEARKLGYDAYQEKLIRTGLYSQDSNKNDPQPERQKSQRKSTR